MTPRDHFLAGGRKEASRHSLTDHDTPRPDGPAWMRSAIPEAVVSYLLIENDAGREAALQRLRRAVAALHGPGSERP